MKELFRQTQLYKAISANEFFSQAVLVIFPDGVYLKGFLKECAKGFFCAADGSREAELIDKEIYSDFLLFPTDKKYTVEMCSRILEESLLLPVECDKKLIVLSDFQSAPALVQNKLLKLIEEPPAGVRFLLGATTEQPILPTVLSRVKKFVEPPFSEDRILNALKRNFPDDKFLLAAAAACGGVYSMAERLALGGGEQFRLAERLLQDLGFDACEEAGKGIPGEVISAMRALLRDAYFCEKGSFQYAGKSRMDLNYPACVLLFALEELDKMERELNFNANFSNCLVAFALKLKEEIDKWKKLS